MKRAIIYSLTLAAVLTGCTVFTPAARADEDPSVAVARENMREYNAALRQQNQQFFQQQQAQQTAAMQQNQ